MNDQGKNGTSNTGYVTPEVPPGVVPTVYPARDFNVSDVMPIRCRSARHVVRVDGVPYAGFDDKDTATNAMHAWRVRWPAVQDKSLDVAPNY